VTAKFAASAEALPPCAVFTIHWGTVIHYASGSAMTRWPQQAGTPAPGAFGTSINEWQCAPQRWMLLQQRQ
jgi:hypothetical protein